MEPTSIMIIITFTVLIAILSIILIAVVYKLNRRVSNLSESDMKRFDEAQWLIEKATELESKNNNLLLACRKAFNRLGIGTSQHKKKHPFRIKNNSDTTQTLIIGAPSYGIPLNPNISFNDVTKIECPLNENISDFQRFNNFFLSKEQGYIIRIIQFDKDDEVKEMTFQNIMYDENGQLFTMSKCKVGLHIDKNQFQERVIDVENKSIINNPSERVSKPLPFITELSVDHPSKSPFSLGPNSIIIIEIPANVSFDIVFIESEIPFDFHAILDTTKNIPD